LDRDTSSATLGRPSRNPVDEVSRDCYVTDCIVGGPAKDIDSVDSFPLKNSIFTEVLNDVVPNDNIVWRVTYS
jgi:hypothetical protein